jgi:hypothetical protein
VLIYCILFPFRLSFILKDNEDEGWVWMVLNPLIDFIFVVDIVFSFRTAYVDVGDDDVVVSSPGRIGVRY